MWFSYVCWEWLFYQLKRWKTEDGFDIHESTKFIPHVLFYEMKCILFIKITLGNNNISWLLLVTYILQKLWYHKQRQINFSKGIAVPKKQKVDEN